MKPQRHLTFPEMEAGCLPLKTATDYLFPAESWADLTWVSREEWLHIYISWGIRASSALPKWIRKISRCHRHCHITNVAPGFSKTQASGGGEETDRQTATPLGLRRFLSHPACSTLPHPSWSSTGPGQTRPAWLPRARHWQKWAAAVSLLPAACYVPKLGPALRGGFPLLTGLNQLFLLWF